jgi:ribosomal protein S2
MATTNSSSRILSQKEADIQMMLAAEVHLGTKNCDFQMERYVFKRRNDGIYFPLSLSQISLSLCFSCLVFTVYRLLRCVM